MLPSKIRQLRLDKGWTQDRLASVTGLSYRTIQRIEKDGRCSLDSKMALASAFDISFLNLIAPVDELHKLKHEALLTLVADTLKTGAWEMDLVTMDVTWTKQVYAIYELDELPTIAEGINFYAPHVRAEIQKAFENLVEFGSPYDMELPFISATGKSLWVRVIGVPVYQDAQLIKASGVIQDITHLKTA